MFTTLDVMISIAVVFLILSMAHKYLMSFIKRLLKIKAKVIAAEMTTFVGENTSKYLIPYLEKKAKHLNFLEDIKIAIEGRKNAKGLRELSKKQLEEIVTKFGEFLEGKTSKEIKDEINSDLSEKQINEKIGEIKAHLWTLKGRIEHMYDNTVSKISEVYETKLRHHTLIWGLVLAVIINADLIDIYNSLSKNAVVRANLISQVEKIDKQMTSIDETVKQKEEKEVKGLEPLIKETTTDITNLTGELEKAGLKLGWSTKRISEVFRSPGGFFNKLLGLFLSGLLISFGAPFWHELLSTFAGLRKKLRK